MRYAIILFIKCIESSDRGCNRNRRQTEVTKTVEIQPDVHLRTENYIIITIIRNGLDTKQISGMDYSSTILNQRTSKFELKYFQHII